MDKKKLVMFIEPDCTTVIVPEGVEVIGESAFELLSYDLEEVKFPTTLKRIEYQAFFAKNMKNIILPESLEYIGYQAFGSLFSYNKINSIHIGRNVKHIGEKAFEGLKIENIEVAEDNELYKCENGILTNKAGDSICHVTSNTNYFNIPDGVTTITESSLPSGTQIEEANRNKVFYFVIPKNVYRFSSKAFNDVMKYSRVEILCDKDSAAEDYARRYDIPYSNIDTSSFTHEQYNYEEDGIIYDVDVINNKAIVSLTIADYREEITIPEEINGIPVTEFHFIDVWGIKEINISKNVSNIQVRELLKLYNLEKINVDAANNYYKDIDGILYDKDAKTLIFCPEKYNKDQVLIETSTFKIGDSAFENNKTVTDVVFNDNLEIIEDNAFIGSSLTSINLPKNLKTIGEYAFLGITSYKGLSIPDSVEEIGDGCFYYNQYDESRFLIDDSTLYLGKNLKFIGRNSFYGLDFSTIKLNPDNKNFIISEGNLMTKDGTRVVLIPSLTEKIIIPEGTIFSGSGVFVNLSKVKDIYIPNSFVDSIEINEASKDVVIYGKEDSKIKYTLIANGFTWVDIKE